MALRVGGDEVEEGDAEAADRLQRATGRCIRGAEDAGQEAKVRVAILPSPLRRERSRDKSTLARTKATRSGARWLRVISVACAVAIRVECDGSKKVMPKTLLDSDAPRGGAYEGPRTQGKWPWLDSQYTPLHSGVREART